ncbi:SDR family oxidoreductase [Planomicrobium glaciei]|nr:SDR family oxidoreductase [Planococcus glaciei]
MMQSIQGTSCEILGDRAPDTSGNDINKSNASFLDTAVPARRGGKPSEVAATIHFLASEGAAYINGEIIHVDGD